MTNQTQTTETVVINSIRTKAIESRANEILNRHLSQAYAAAAVELEQTFSGATNAPKTAEAKCGTTTEEPKKTKKAAASVETDPFDLEPETAEEPEAEEEEEETVGFTQDMVAKGFSDYAKKSEKHKTRALKILKGLGAKSIKDLSPLKFKEAMKLLSTTANM